MAKQRALLENWGNFKTAVQMCQRAIDKNKVKDFKRLLESLDASWNRLNADFEVYKEEVISKTAKSEVNFNSTVENDKGEVMPAYSYNDNWKDAEFNKYADIREVLQDKLDAIEAAGAADVEKVTSTELNKNAEQIVVEIKNEINTIDTAVNNMHTEIHGYIDGSMSSATVSEHKSNIDRFLKIVNEDFKTLVQSKLDLKVESTDSEYSDKKLRIHMPKSPKSGRIS